MTTSDPNRDATASSSDAVLVERDGRAAIITINRPDQRNALNRAVRSALPRAIRELEADDGIDVMILTGADPAFSAGIDLKELGAGAARPSDVTEGTDRDGRLPYRGALPPHDKLIIGAINGVAVTGGFEIALNCDFMIASVHARFADTHARVGIMPGWGLTVLLAQRIGVARARQLSVTGNYLDAQTAYEWGLVNEVVAHDALLPRCLELARDCSTIDQRAVRRMLATYREVTDTTVAEAWDLETRASKEWQAGGLDPAAIEARRRSVVERGRAQLGG